MTIQIPGAMIARIMRSAAPDARPAHEACGILSGRADRILRADFADNVSPTPEVAFEIAPAALIAAYRSQRLAGGLDILGFFHTHPGGDPFPSPRDARCAAPDGMLWLIVTSAQARLWKAVKDGRVHGRFDPVRFDLRPAPRIAPGQLGMHVAGIAAGRIE